MPGFQSDSSKAPQLVCRIEDSARDWHYPCRITNYDASSDSTQIKVQVEAAADLEAECDYYLTLSQVRTNSSEVLGLTWPTHPGLFSARIESHDDSVPLAQAATSYIEVLPPAWKTLRVRSHVTLEKEWNLLSVQITPTNNIEPDHLLILAIPTAGLPNSATQSAVPLFTENIKGEFARVRHEMINGTQLSMECRYFSGSVALGEPIRIACSKFNQTVNDSCTVSFLLEIQNPDIDPAAEYFIPIEVYSYNPSTQTKLNYDIVPRGIYVSGQSQAEAAVTGNFQYSVSEVSAAGDFQMDIQVSGSPVGENDSVVIRFNSSALSQFAEQSAAAGCCQVKDVGTGSVVGEALVAAGLDILILKPLPGQTLSTQTIALTNTWLNPKLNEQALFGAQSTQVSAYVCRPAARSTEKIVFQDQLPVLTARQSTGIKLQLVAINDNYEQQQDEDYILVLSSTAWELSKLVVIEVPPTLGFNAGADCMQAPNSDVVVAECYMNTATNTIWAEIYNPTQTFYEQGQAYTLRIQTMGKSIQNPNSA